MNRSKVSIKLVSLFLTFVIVLGLIPKTQVQAAPDELPGLGQVSDRWTRDIFNKVQFSKISSENQAGLQKANLISFNPQNTKVKPRVVSGDYVYGGNIMSDFIRAEEAKGDRIAFAINGDGYDTSNGIASGMTINDGKLILTSYAPGRYSMGFKEDGSIVYGPTDVFVKAQIGAKEIKIQHVNRERKADQNGTYFLDENFSQTTHSRKAGVEVVLDIQEKDYRGLNFDKEVKAKLNRIEIVDDNTEGNQTAIHKGQIVLSAHKDSEQYSFLTGLPKDQEVTFTLIDNSHVGWKDVNEAIGIFTILMLEGQRYEDTLKNTDIHPRTVVGIKADGSLVLMQNEGRQAGYANGLTYKDMVDYLSSIGCTTVFNFDGGGSSTIAATLPGDDSFTILNRPSDGRERANANALLFIKEETENTNQIEKLHIYPKMHEGYATKVNLLENAKMEFVVKATDRHYNPLSLDPATLDFRAEGGVGDISDAGVLTAAEGSHEGKIVVRDKVTGVEAGLEINVVDSITDLVANVSILSVAPGKDKTLSFKGQSNGVSVIISSESLNFELSDPELGSISENGQFIAGEKQGTGELYISFKDYSMTIPVEVGKLPVPLNDFEVPFEDMNWTWRFFNANGSRGGDAKMSINYDERFVKTGDGSLRVDYDFATNPVSGTVTCEAGPKQGYRTLEGQPKAIGVWIYGDGKGAWIRIQLSGGKYVGSEHVTWKGWKYIETPIPEDAPFPYELIWGIRVLATPSLSVNNKKGTLYFDGLRAVYDYKNDDTLKPELDESYTITPADGQMEVGRQPNISLKVYDPKVEDKPYTGINTERTKLWINGVVQDNIIHEVDKEGAVTISHIPSALTALRPGPTHVKYRVEDNAGNKMFKEWDFTVKGYAVNLYETKPEGDKAYAGQVFNYDINAYDYKDFEEGKFEISYNPKFVELLAAKQDSRIEDAQVEIDEAGGLIKASLKGMDGLEANPENPLLRLKFRVTNEAGGQTGILVNKALVKQTGELEGSNLVLEGFDREIDRAFTLSAQGTTVGKPITFRVFNDKDEPVEGLELNVLKEDGSAISLEEKTDENGQLVTSALSQYPIGSKFLISVISDKGVSNEVTLELKGSLGEKTPAKIALATGENPAHSVGITWETSFEVDKGQLVYATDENFSNPITLEASSKDVLYRLGSQDRESRRWEIMLTGLDANTEYFYKVGHEENYSEIRSFRTAKTDDVTIQVLGDLQGGYDNFPSVYENMKTVLTDPDLIVQVGDFADNNNDYNEWTAIDRNMKSVLDSNIWSSVVGNHDSNNDAEALTSYFNSPSNGTHEESRNYHYEIGNAVVYVLDTESYNYDPGFTGQIRKMQEVFNNSDKLFKIVVQHRTPYPQNYDELDVRKLAPLYESMGVDLVLTGHDHVYSRTSMKSALDGEGNLLLAKSPTLAGDAAAYVVMGSSTGSKYYSANTGRPWTDVVYDDNNPTFAKLNINEKTLNFKAYAIEAGQVREIDDFSIRYYGATFNPENVKGPEKVRSNSNVEFEILNPNPGRQKISQVLVNGESVEVEDSKIQVEKVNSDLAIEVKYETVVDKAMLESALERAKAKDLTVVQEAGAKALEEAITDGEVILAKEDASQEEVDLATEAISLAIENLVAKADLTVLNTLRDYLKSQLDLLTPESKAELEEALKSIEGISPENSQEEVDEKAQRLADLLSKLVYAEESNVDTSVLEEIMKLAEAKLEDDITNTSKASIEERLEEAGNLPEEAGQDDINKAIVALVKAIAEAEDLVYSISIEEVKDKDILAVHPGLGDYQDSAYKIYNVEVQDQEDNAHKELKKAVEVRIALDNLGFDEEQIKALKVFNAHSQEAEGLLEVSFEIKDNQLILLSDKFSEFVIIAPKAAENPNEDETGETDNPDETGSDSTDPSDSPDATKPTSSTEEPTEPETTETKEPTEPEKTEMTETTDTETEETAERQEEHSNDTQKTTATKTTEASEKHSNTAGTDDTAERSQERVVKTGISDWALVWGLSCIVLGVALILGKKGKEGLN